MNIDSRFVVNRPIQPNKTNQTNQQNKVDQQNKTPFKKIFEQKLEKSKVNFSKHAKERLADRNINLSAADIQRLQKGVEKADSKGSKDSLILMNNVAYIVSVKNNTVVTAVDGENMKEKVFTNIDSTVML